MKAAALTPARKSSRWLWFLIKKLILIGYMVGGVGRIFGKIVSCSLASLLPWLHVFSAVWKSKALRTMGFFEDQTAVETKDLERPVHPAVRLWTAFMMFVNVCNCVCLWGPVHCIPVCVHICVCLCTRKCWSSYPVSISESDFSPLTLAVYTGNCSPRLNLPLPAGVSHHRASLAALLLAPCWLYHCAPWTSLIHFIRPQKWNITK